jgi:hypothetical protein
LDPIWIFGLYQDSYYIGDGITAGQVAVATIAKVCLSRMPEGLMIYVSAGVVFSVEAEIYWYNML